MTAAAPTAPRTAFVVLVPEAQTRVQSLRQRFDPSAALGAPAHITVLHPFMPPAQITPLLLARAAGALCGVAGFDFRLARVGSFPTVVYLAPEPAVPFVALTRALVDAFPAFPSFGGVHDRIVPHLTVAQGGPDALQEAAAALQAGLREHGTVHARCRHLSLLENASGRWREMHRLALLPPAAEGAPER